MALNLTVLSSGFLRFLRGIPVVGAVLVLSLILLNEPPDPDAFASFSGSSGFSQHPQNQRLQKVLWRRQRGYDKPVFYFSILPVCLSDSLRTIPEADVRQAMRNLSLITGNGQEVWNYYNALLKFLDATYLRASIKAGENLSRQRLMSEVHQLMRTAEPSEIEKALHRLDTLPALPLAEFNKLKSAWQLAVAVPHPWRRYVPSVRWHPDCRFHMWIWGTPEQPGLLRGSLGRSYRDGRPVAEVLAPRLGLTLLLSLLALWFAFSASLILTFVTQPWPQTLSRILNAFLYGLYAIPSFVMGSLLIVFFTGGRFLDWFPSYGTGEWTEGLNLGQALRDNFAYFILPLFCWSYGALCYLFMQERRSLKEVESEPWFTALRAKGLPNTRMLIRHALPVILVPAVTLVGQLFPMLLGGAIVLEVLFSLPGMGELTYHAVIDGDTPVLLAVVWIGSFATLVSFLISDMLILRLDPRASFNTPTPSS